MAGQTVSHCNAIKLDLVCVVFTELLHFVFEFVESTRKKLFTSLETENNLRCRNVFLGCECVFHYHYNYSDKGKKKDEI